MKSKEIDYIECKFIMYRAKNIDREDTHIVKELVTYKDGSTEPRLNIIKNFTRPFYITKEHFRRHKQKKEYEDLNKVNKFFSTQSDMPNTIASKLEMPGYKRNQYRDVLKSPYLYGSDISSNVILSKLYEDKYGTRFSPYAVSTLDIESDIDTKEITVISTAFKKQIRTTINRTLLKNFKLTEDDWIIEEIKRLFKKHMKKNSQDYELIITIHEDEVECIKNTFSTLHKWKPDFLAIWNVAFDIRMMEEALKRGNVDVKTVFSDPDLPHELKEYRFKEGANKKKKADGTTSQIDVQDRWHVIHTSSSFYIIDAMCSYSQIRAGASKVIGGYGMDNIAKKELGKNAGKVVFEGLLPENTSKDDWHRLMSRDHPLEYIVYNMGDNTEMLDLDAKTSDLKVVLPTLAGHSNFDNFNSGPTKIVDKLYHEILEDGIVLGTKPATNDFDKLLGLNKWIVTLEASKITNDGMKILKGDITSNTDDTTVPSNQLSYDMDTVVCDTINNNRVNLSTNIRWHVYDSDAVSSYPSDSVAANLSKTTTKRELLSVQGKDKELFKMNNINLVFGPINSTRYVTEMLNGPQLDEILDLVKTNYSI